MSLRIYFLLLLSSPLYLLYGQTVLRGSIKDADNGLPLIGANVQIDGQQIGTISDSLGLFRFNDLAPGRYQLQVSYLGYQQLNINEILLSSGKEKILALELEEAPTSLSSVIVKGRKAQLPSPSLIHISQEETLRFPATFFDPARIAAAYPSVNNANDQANHLIIRGQSPVGMKWRLEGHEIINPNHTANAGTFSDRISASGGGINAFSAQVLDQAILYVGNTPAHLGNATAGIMDMQLKNGNNEKREYTIQAGLIGLDFATEGPIKKGKSSYIINYRYSFTGLLSDLGVPLGDEDIRFQDLSFKLYFPGKNNSQLNVFGLLGKSSNAFYASTDSLEWTTDKDLYENILFDSKMGVIGFNWRYPQGKKGQWHLSSVWSGLVSSRQANSSSDLIPNNEYNRLEDQKKSFRATYRHKLIPFGHLKIGIEALQNSTLTEIVLPKRNQWSIHPYLNWQYNIKKLNLQLGYRGAYFTEWTNNNYYNEPKLTASYQFSKNNTVGIDYNQQTQTPSPYSSLNEPKRAQQFSIYWNSYLKKDIKFSIIAYQQQLSGFAGQGALSELNQLESLEQYYNQDSTKGKNKGIEANLQHFANGQWWYVFGVGIFDSRYQNEEGEWLNTRYASNYNVSATVGKEWSSYDEEQQQKRLGFNISLRLNGGQRSLPILVEESQQLKETVFDYTQGFTQQFPSYFRMDFRLYYQKNRAKWNSILSFDIQNLSDQENVAYDYFDRLTNQVERRFQLPLIPIMSYQINF